MVLRCLVVEKNVLAFGDELNLLVQLRDRCLGHNGVVNATLHVNLALLFRHVVGDEDDVDIVTLLAQIGDGSNVLTTHISLEKDNEMLIRDVRSTYLGGILVGRGHANQLTRDIPKTFLCLRIVA